MKLREPDSHRLLAIDRYLRRFTSSPTANLGVARFGTLLCYIPWPLRYLLWYWGLNAIGWDRVWLFGTFGVSVYSGLGAASLHPLSSLSF